MYHLKRSMLVCMLAIVLTTLLSAGVAQAATVSGPTWSIVPSPNHGKGWADELFGVAAVSATDVWAVGSSYHSSTYQPLIEHWNGANWQTVPSPGSGNNDLFGVAAVSATDVWAVGTAHPATLIEHWNGANWQVIPSPNPGSGANFLSGVAVVSATNIWAVGDYENSNYVPQPLIEHWNGTRWQVTSPNPRPGNGSLGRVVAVSATDIWAVGNYSNGTLIEHWNGTSWKVVSSPNPGSFANELSDVAVISATDIWAVGDYENGCCSGPTLIEHWNGTTWQIVSSPNGGKGYNYLSGVAVISATDIWAVGSYYNSTKQQNETLTELYS